jgi:hypothetical protein
MLCEADGYGLANALRSPGNNSHFSFKRHGSS